MSTEAGSKDLSQPLEPLLTRMQRKKIKELMDAQDFTPFLVTVKLERGGKGVTVDPYGRVVWDGES